MSRATRDLADRQEIADLLFRYATALDTRDWQLLSTCFTPTAVAVYEGLGEFSPYAAIEGVCRAALEPLDGSHHVVSNVVAEVEGDSARATSYVVAQHVRAGAPGGDFYTLGGVYTDELVRTADGWRIARRRLARVWTSGNPRVLEL